MYFENWEGRKGKQRPDLDVNHDSVHLWTLYRQRPALCLPTSAPIHIISTCCW